MADTYCSVDDLRSQLEDEDAQLDDQRLERAAEAASRAVDRWTCRRFWRDASAVARVYRPDQPDLVWTDDISSTAGLIVKTDDNFDGVFETTWAATDYRLEPLNNELEDPARPWWQLCAASSTRIFPSDLEGRRPTVQVTARFGWLAVPTEVQEATILKAAAVFKRKDAVYGAVGFGDLGVMRISARQDPTVVELLAPYVLRRHRTLDYDPQRMSLFHGGRR